ncbi:MAG: NMD3 family protein [Candidatus Argoarchaeum ethanivorans]|uniref:NMD3 family protein n=1 Tax=Candidatus Argoarchaeum ethanivorans TaxID=2608793 RepID=A0A812A372_9EURY|nr:MAG: NMD3 family protein [Candidatus Argoarchaeum ethanivorans]
MPVVHEFVSLLHHPNAVSIQVCPVCRAYRKKGQWIYSNNQTVSVDEIVLTVAKENIKVEKLAENSSIKLDVEHYGHSIYPVHIHAEAVVSGKPVVYDGLLRGQIHFETCDVCNRIAGGYYEAIIQLRGDSRIPTETEVQECSKIMQKLLERIKRQGNRLALITRTEKLKEGTNFYLASNKAAKKACRKLVIVYAATLTESNKLVGRKDGRDVYRMTYALRLPRFKEGDTIKYNNRFLNVIRIGKNITAVDLLSDVSVTLHKEQIKQAKKIAGIDDAKTAILISSDKTSVQIMDPDTYKTLTMRKPAFISDDKREVKILKINDEILIIK